MRRLLLVVIAICVLIFIVILEDVYESKIKDLFNQSSIDLDQSELQSQIEVAIEPVYMSEKTGSDLLGTSVHTGMTGEQIQNLFGDPVRKDLSAYGYEWWIYPLIDDEFIQIGMKENNVVTIFKTYDHMQMTYDHLKGIYQFEANVEVNAETGFYQFELTEDDLKMRPLLKVGEDWFQLHFDSFTGDLSSVRVMTEEILLIQKPYSISYRGHLPEQIHLTKEEWNQIEEGEAQQIFDYTNYIRKRHELELLEWEQAVANVAKLHSQEMKDNNYFSHHSPTQGELKDRLTNANVRFKVAGENIAAKYVDGLAAVEGWLNSEGHRVNLLNEEYTHLGIGVYRHYYTQNFMTPWSL